ncbi:hypothetical protein ACX8XP_08715 [Calditrichota bacterium LG25]
MKRTKTSCVSLGTVETGGVAIDYPVKVVHPAGKIASSSTVLRGEGDHVAARVVQDFFLYHKQWPVCTIPIGWRSQQNALGGDDSKGQKDRDGYQKNKTLRRPLL